MRDVQPLGLRNSLVKLFHPKVMNQSKMEIREYLEPVQAGMSKAGAAKLVLLVGGAIRANIDHICCRIDLSNAFNEITKQSILDDLDQFW